MTALYPLRFREILRDYGFGNRWIAEEFSKDDLPKDHRIAETWEVCDRPGESSVVTNGDLAGKSLGELIATYGEELLGSEVMAVSGSRFPLLVKFLDASHPLGEQVHHDDSLAAQLELPDTGKTEAWYMLKTRPGATIHCGARDGIGLNDVHDALINDTTREIMQEHQVGPGDAFLLHAGTVHYTHGGVLFYEILQNSDVYVGLRNRELALGTADREQWATEALRAVKPVGAEHCGIPPVTIASGANSSTFVLTTRYFALERLDLTSPHELACAGDKFSILTQIEGDSTITCNGNEVPMIAGSTCLLPATLGAVTITPKQECSILKAYVPDLLSDVVEPLRAAGVNDSKILALGGAPDLNPLMELMG